MVEYSKVLIAEQYRVGSETYYAPCLGSFFLSPIMGDEMPLELVVLDLAKRL